MGDYIGAIDQGTTSTRFMIFNARGGEVARHQLEHEQIMPRPGWLEHDPLEIIEKTLATMRGALERASLRAVDLAAIGITNQRETTVVWNPHTGRPWHHAIVWQDTRNEAAMTRLARDGRTEWLRERTGLPPATYFSAGKVQWLLDNVAGLRAAAERGEALLGTIDSWLIWNLTGGTRGGVHATDVTNAGRTQLMNIATLDWDDELLALFGIPRAMLPEIKSSVDPGFGTTRDGVALCGVLGDQQAAMMGQVCFAPGEAKNTYGTGNFLLLNTGAEPVASQAGLLTTPCYRIAAAPAIYALEGAIAVTGSAVQWLRDQMGLIHEAAEIEVLARQVDDAGGMVFVPAFSGLFAPWWRSDARGAVVGLTRYHTRAHFARATLEAICHQSRDVALAMEQDAGIKLEILKVDGGATVNETLMQLQADILGVPVVRPRVAETTALGAAYAAGLGAGVWRSPEELRAHWQADRQWEPRWSADQREAGHAQWRKAIERTLNWVE